MVYQPVNRSLKEFGTTNDVRIGGLDTKVGSMEQDKSQKPVFIKNQERKIESEKRI